MSICIAGRYPAGSSPHTRGAPLRSVLAVNVDGIIPAYAGSTSWSRSRGARSEDHPRIRGEHPSSPSVVLDFVGSSPHTRGALVPAAGVGVRGGIIPAYAGSTVAGGERGAEDRDHPRIRGEHSYLRGSLPRSSEIHAHFFEAKERFDPNFRAFLYLDAPLQPLGKEPISVASSVPAGRFINFRPSQSTGTQSGWNTSNSKCCSFLALYTMIARPDFTNEHTRCQRRSLTRADSLPTNTPGAISNIQRVKSPRAPGGQAVKTITTTLHHPLAHRCTACLQKPLHIAHPRAINRPHILQSNLHQKTGSKRYRTPFFS